jgi:hypothetical protein
MKRQKKAAKAADPQSADFLLREALGSDRAGTIIRALTRAATDSLSNVDRLSEKDPDLAKAAQAVAAVTDALDLLRTAEDHLTLGTKP